MNDSHNEEQTQAGANTPLEQKQQQQAMQRKNLEVAQHPDPTPDVPGAGPPSNKREHPQRQMYEGGTADSETI